MYVYRKLLFTLAGLAFMLAPTLTNAGVTGRIAGGVTNAETGEALVGVTVEVVGTDLGAITDVDGAYFILQVPVGLYEVRFTSVGFEPLTAQNIDVSADKTTSFDAKMEVATTELEGITVVVEPPLVEKGRDLSVTTVKAEQIRQLPTRGYDQVVQLQSGVVTFRQSRVNRARGGREASTAPELNIRGGRPTSVAYLVDGFSQQDPLSGLSTTSINNNAIEEVSVMTGGFPAEYGYVSSGVVNTITKSGSEEFSGSFEILTDEVLGDKGFRQTTGGVSLGGPLKVFEDATFYISGEKRYLGDRQPSAGTQDFLEGGLQSFLSLDSDRRLPDNSSRAWTFQGKMRWKLTPAVVLQLGGNGSRDKWQEYRHNQLFNSPHNPRYDDQNYGAHAKLTHTVNPKTFYNLAVAWFQTQRERGDGVRWNDLFHYTNDEFKGSADVTGNNDINLFYDVGSTAVPGGYLKRKSSYVQFSGDLTTRPDANHLVKAGFAVERHTLKRFNHVRPFNVADKLDSTSRWQDADYYGYSINDQDTLNPIIEEDLGDGLNDAKKPVSISLYAQDRINWSGMILTLGVRWDYFDYKTKRFKDETAPLGADGNSLDPEDIEDAPAINKLSPRVGVAFPVDDRTNMHFSYGKFFKRPDLDKLYVGFNYVEYKMPLGGYFFPFGNPNLEPEKTTAYELGLTRQVGDYTALDVTAFYRDITDLTQVIHQSSFPKAFDSYQNADYATVKGLELGLRMRRVRSVQMDLKYTLSSAKGTGSFAQTQRNVAWTANNAPIQASPLDFDQRHTFTGTIDVRRFESAEPNILNNAGISAVVKYSSGTPYTKSIVFNEVSLAAVSPQSVVPINSVYGPATFVIDMKADKTFDLGGLELNAYVWVQNVLDTKNEIYVYESSGDADNTGWLNTPAGQSYAAGTSVPDPMFGDMNGEELYNLRSNDPTNFSNPRVILFGLNFLF